MWSAPWARSFKTSGKIRPSRRYRWASPVEPCRLTRRARALDEGIYQVNVEGEPELEALSEVASSMGTTAPITIRVNPDVDAKTHAKITTGTYETKFGVPWSRARETYAQAAKLPGIAVVGV